MRRKGKQCNCKNSRCLKLYCECFASGQYCEPGSCNCLNCFNNRVSALRFFGLARPGANCRGSACFEFEFSKFKLGRARSTAFLCEQESEQLRAEAVEATLERNPAAFRPKIAQG